VTLMLNADRLEKKLKSSDHRGLWHGRKKEDEVGRGDKTRGGPDNNGVVRAAGAKKDAKSNEKALPTKSKGVEEEDRGQTLSRMEGGSVSPKKKSAKRRVIGIIEPTAT